MKNNRTRTVWTTNIPHDRHEDWRERRQEMKRRRQELAEKLRAKSSAIDAANNKGSHSE